MKTPVFGDFIVKKVKKVNENICFLALLIDFHMFCIGFHMFFNTYNESVLLLPSFPQIWQRQPCMARAGLETGSKSST